MHIKPQDYLADFIATYREFTQYGLALQIGVVETISGLEEVLWSMKIAISQSRLQRYQKRNDQLRSQLAAAQARYRSQAL